MKLPILQELVQDARQYVFLELDDPRIIALEEAKNRTAEYSIQNDRLRALLSWRIMYLELHVRVASTYSTRFPLDHLENLDTMYEIWILLEMLDFLRIQGYTISIIRFPREFEVRKGTIHFTIHYEKTYMVGLSVEAASS